MRDTTVFFHHNDSSIEPNVRIQGENELNCSLFDEPEPTLHDIFFKAAVITIMPYPAMQL